MGGVCYRDETMLSFDRMEVSSAWYGGMFFRDKNSPLLDRMKVGLAYYGGIGGKLLRDKNTQFLD